MKRGLSFVVLVALCVCTGAWAEENYAAIAWSRSMLRVGLAKNEPTETAARDVALRECGYKDCAIWAMTHNGCVSYAMSKGPGKKGLWWYGFADHYSKKDVERLALSICEYNAGTYCQIMETFCTNEPLGIEAEKVEDVMKELGEKGPDADGVLRLVNLVTGKYLQDEAGISRAVAERLSMMKFVPSIKEMVDRTGMRASDLRKIWGFAKTHGYIKT